jgi:hypothetical protein
MEDAFRFADELGPYKLIEIYRPAVGLKAVVAIDNIACGPALARLSDDAIDTMIEHFGRCPTPMGQVLLEHFHGAAARVGITDTAFPHRTVGYNFLVARRR